MASKIFKFSFYFIFQIIFLLSSVYFNFFDKKIWEYYHNNNFYYIYLSVISSVITYGIMLACYTLWAFLTCCFDDNSIQNIFKFSFINFIIVISYYGSILYSFYLLIFDKIVLEKPYDILFQFLVYGGFSNLALITLWTCIEKICICRNKEKYKLMDEK